MTDVTSKSSQRTARPVEWMYVWRAALVGLVSGALNAVAVSFAIHSTVLLSFFMVLEGFRAAVAGLGVGVVASLLVWLLSLVRQNSLVRVIVGAITAGILYGLVWLTQVADFVPEARGAVIAVGVSSGILLAVVLVWKGLKTPRSLRP